MLYTPWINRITLNDKSFWYVAVSPQGGSLYLHDDGKWRAYARHRDENTGHYCSRKQAEDALASYQSEHGTNFPCISPTIQKVTGGWAVRVGLWEYLNRTSDKVSAMVDLEENVFPTLETADDALKKYEEQSSAEV